MLRKLLVLSCALTAAVVIPVVAAPLAAAQDDEVFVDPGSPSGKEYAIPIDRARQQGGASTSKGSRSQKAPLFGEGVDGNSTGGNSTGGNSTGGNSTGGNSTGGTATAPKRVGTQAKDSNAGAGEPSTSGEEARDGLDASRGEAERALQAAAAPEGGIGVGGIIAAAVAVLLVGGLIGLWLRRRATP